MNSNWKCGHARRSVHSYFGTCSVEKLTDDAANGNTLQWRGIAADELRDRRLPCPACSSQNRRIRRAWLWVGIAAVCVLVVGWRSCS